MKIYRPNIHFTNHATFVTHDFNWIGPSEYGFIKNGDLQVYRNYRPTRKIISEKIQILESIDGWPAYFYGEGNFEMLPSFLPFELVW